MPHQTSLPPTTIPQGSWILITGITGYIASHIALGFLNRGYCIRGTTRGISKSSWTETSLFPPQTKDGSFELVSVHDLAAPGAFNEAIKGISAVVHVASNTSYSGDPNVAITPTVNGTLNLLHAAAAESSVKRFVFTGTIGAADTLMSSEPVRVTKDSWNEEAEKVAWQEPYGAEKGYVCYSASKVATEKAVWKFGEEEKPGFEMNVVCPYMVLGDVLGENQNPGARTMMKGFITGDEFTAATIAIIPPVGYVNTYDNAVIHVRAVLDPAIKNERIFAWAYSVTWNDVLAIMSDLYPDRPVAKDLENPKKVMVYADMSVVKSLLKKWGPREDWTPFEKGVKDILAEVSFELQN